MNITRAEYEDLLKRKPQLFADPAQASARRGAQKTEKDAAPSTAGNPASASKRIRQRTKGPNKLERDWFAHLNAQFPNYPRPRLQAKAYRLANGVVYWPDVTTSCWPAENGGPAKETAWECKGPQKPMDDSVVKLKVAASIWPEVQWILVWREGSIWRQQLIIDCSI